MTKALAPRQQVVRFSGPLARWLVAALWLNPLGAALAQTAGEPPALLDWRVANDAVAQFKRGHMDLLEWESRHVPKEPQATDVKPDVALMTPAEAVREAWAQHPDLARVQNRLGAEVAQRVADGQWDSVDASLQRRVDGMDEWLGVAAEARKAWINAVAARKALRFREAALTAAEAGSGLGQRMVSVGNWSPLQWAPVRLAASAARMDLHRAQLAVVQADGVLRQLVGPAGALMALGLPGDFPAWPAQAMTREAWAQHLEAVQAQLPGVDAVRNRAASTMAFEVYSTGHALAQISRDELLKQRRYITEETVLHYNGMLKSVWDLLDEVRNQAVAEIAAIDAERDFWLAQTDLQWTLQGGVPSPLVSLGGPGPDAIGPAAH